MKLSALITELQSLLQTHGDASVVTACYNDDVFVGVGAVYFFRDADCPGVVVIEEVDIRLDNNTGSAEI